MTSLQAVPNRHAKTAAALRKIASFSLRDERETAKVGGILAGNYKV